MNIPRETQELFQDLQERYDRVKDSFQEVKRRQEIEQLEIKTQDPGFWNDTDIAQKITQSLSSQKKVLDQWENLTQSVEYVQEIFDLDDASMLSDIEEEIPRIETNLDELETRVLLSGEYDGLNAILTLHVGNGGQDAEDFTNILYRMYLRFAEQQDFKVILLEESPSDDGLKSATLQIQGPMAYGLLKSENGVHRLIRQSPFNAKGLRQTSFARVEVIPEIEQDTDVEIEEKDLRVDVFRASGNGGQSVNTTDSAVRITYIPLGISVSCQNEKSQLQNKQTALKILKSKLLKLQSEQHAEEMSQIRGDVMENSFGSQIRTYTLHPYKLVKDHRTNKEINNPTKVFDGEITPFIFSYLKHETQK